MAALGWFYKAEISEAINKPATEATAELNFSEESTPVLPSEESSEQQEGGETLDDVQSEESTAAKEITAPKQMSSTNPVDGASEETDAAKSDAVDIEAVNANAADADADSSVLESANDDNTIEQPSSPTTTEGTDSTENVDDISDSPMLEPNAAVESDAAPAADSEPQDSILGVQDSNSDRNGQDVDLQVETALTSLELGMKEIEDEASAKSALPQLEESVARLEDLIKTSDQWNDVDKELIDMQLREATGVFGKLKKSVIGMPDVKSVVTPTFERLEKLLVPQQTTAP